MMIKKVKKQQHPYKYLLPLHALVKEWSDYLKSIFLY
ncbi:hypothetical protein B0I21_10877 [Sphingobacterium paludis]|uniref:Uncharacterized protein n=1 Tax=Sphingobacterium paludis TaxID=1476465 RepID=A0A4R7CUU2_9SPHI|nr:hypothetical protein B0I21_10877 [Sphingobacterium paludis]